MARPPKRPVGRPTKYNPEMCDLVIKYMSQGYSKEACCGFLDITDDTLYRWVKEHEDFSEAVKRGTAACMVFWEKLMIAGAEGKIKNFNPTAAIFQMKNRFPRHYRDKHEIEHSGESLGAQVVITLPDNGHSTK